MREETGSAEHTRMEDTLEEGHRKQDVRIPRPSYGSSLTIHEQGSMDDGVAVFLALYNQLNYIINSVYFIILLIQNRNRFFRVIHGTKKI